MEGAGILDSIWRYPIKSMAGEELEDCKVTECGVLGDRAYALVDLAANKTASVRTWAAALLNYQAQFVTEPETGAPMPPVRITLPDGTTVISDQANANELLSAKFGRSLTVANNATAGLLIELPAGTLGGKYAALTEVPLAGGAPPGTFFDYGTVHIVTSSTLELLQRAYPQGRFDVRRFRPNFVIQVDSDTFLETDLPGRTLRLGDQVELRVGIPCPRCVNTTLPQSELPHDAGILRTIAQLNRLDLVEHGRLPCVGVYADVIKTGAVRRGDAVAWS
jgi:uncharacterized protein YcbX